MDLNPGHPAVLCSLSSEQMSRLTVPPGLYHRNPHTPDNQSSISNHTCTPGCRSLGPWLSPSVAWMKAKPARRQLGQPSQVSNWVASQSRPWVSGVWLSSQPVLGQRLTGPRSAYRLPGSPANCLPPSRSSVIRAAYGAAEVGSRRASRQGRGGTREQGLGQGRGGVPGELDLGTRTYSKVIEVVGPVT